jgi:capsular polysaccharide export protein
MRGRVAVLSAGIWRLRAQVQRLTGCQPVRPFGLGNGNFDYVVGWGMKATGERARRLADRLRRPYLSIEDGFLRSVRPGQQEPPISLVMDCTGVHYDARRPSDLETLIAESVHATSKATLRRARAGIAELRRHAISKYNDGPRLSPEQLGLGGHPGRPRVLVVDQTNADCSIEFGLANADTFSAMLHAAQVENPDADIIVKTHPEVITNRKKGYLGHLSGPRIRTVSKPVNPWSLMEAVDRVYVVTSQLGFEALLAGRQVTCFGAPFYAGWGLTDDRVSIPRRTGRPTLEQLFAAVYLKYARYFSPYDGQEISFEQAIHTLAFLRDRFLDNSQKSICVRVSRWKRPTIDRLLDGIGGKPEHVATIVGAVRKAKNEGARIVTWASRCSPRLVETCQAAGVPLVRIEDGFVRSAGLGAAYVPGCSIALDTRGIYYDARHPSDLEHLLQTAEVSAELRLRAHRLRHEMIRRRLTKYNLDGGLDADLLPSERTVILVPGQVEDDQSVLNTITASVKKRRGESINLALLRAVRERNPDAFILFKPHPDVASGLRRGKVRDGAILAYADAVVRGWSILPSLEVCDQVATLSSLTGFEALIRGKPVTTYGLPFYGGWGLTEDLVCSPRRTRRRTLDELVAIALILYPRYIHPKALLPCEPEVMISALASELQHKVPTDRSLIAVPAV